MVIVNKAAMNVGGMIFFLISVFIFFKFMAVELLGHMVALFLVFWGTSMLISIVAAPIYIPTISVPGFSFLQILSNSCCL